MFKDKLKLMFNLNKEGTNKRKIENLVFLVVILIITIVFINYIWSGSKTSNKSITNTTGKKLASNSESDILDENKGIINSNNSLEEKLENILKSVNGVGDVKVFINYSESTETVAMYNENSKTSITEETDTSGGVRKIEESNSQKEIVYQEDGGDKIPIIRKTIQPKIEGAIITAQGANNASLKANIIQAVEAATGLATHKIQVFEMSSYK